MSWAGVHAQCQSLTVRTLPSQVVRSGRVFHPIAIRTPKGGGTVSGPCTLIYASAGRLISLAYPFRRL